uniref:Uncharacterized protein n=1 Tax=Candidatus Kentrum sp. TC TaxID=2126339 RepID=A0A450ZJ16_9GAMM|nr:MAG: hypothetical protein BECKTC1821F_GA0114240_100363 [Candidatus Kentron sp. TC]
MCFLEENRHPAFSLKHRLLRIQTHPIYPFDIQNHLIFQQFTDGLLYDDYQPRLILELLPFTARFMRLLTEVYP